MSTDVDAGDDDTEKINVRVPRPLLETIDEEYERRGYTSRSEAIRDALRDWANPSIELSEELLADLAATAREDDSGRSLEEVADDYDVDLDE